MTTPGKVVDEYTSRPFELYFMRGKTFTIIEQIKKNTDLREIQEINKWNKKQTSFFIKIEEGLYQKDLKLNSNENEALFLAIPKAITNYAGVQMEVDQNFMLTRKLKYVGTVSQDLNGNKLNDSGATPNYETPRDTRQPDLNPVEPIDQVKAAIETLSKDMAKMYAVNSSEYKIDIKILTNVANSIMPGKALDLISAAKAQGAIYEQPAGTYKVS